MPADAQMLVDVDFQPLGAQQVEHQFEEQENDQDEDPGVEVGDAPALIYTPSGIYEVPDTFILRDHDLPLHIKPRKWRAARHEHHALSAASFLQNETLTAAHIVCIADPDGDANKSPVLWFVRLAIDGGNTAFTEPFGTSFLWQLPHGVTIKIMMALEQFEKDNHIDDDQGSLLLRTLACSHEDFKPEEWPEFTKVTRFASYYDSVFAMACAPCAKPLRSWKEGELPHKMSLARPVAYQPSGKRAYFDSSIAPDDAMACIMDAAAQRLVDSPHSVDFQGLLKLRLVCKSWRDSVSRVTSTHFKDVLRLVRHGIQTGAMSDVIQARDKALGSGLATIAVIQDSAYPIGLLNYMRVKSVKRPGSLPPGPLDTPPVSRHASVDSPREEEGCCTEVDNARRQEAVDLMEHAPLNVADAL